MNAGGIPAELAVIHRTKLIGHCQIFNRLVVKMAEALLASQREEQKFLRAQIRTDFWPDGIGWIPP